MTSKNSLTLIQRILVVVIYIFIFVLIARFFSGDFGFILNSDNKYNQLFVSVALLLIFGAYIAEPFFTKPTDVLVNSTGIFLFLLSIKHPENFIGYELLKYLSLGLLIITLLIILTSQILKRDKWQEVFIDVLLKVGQSKVTYSIIYLASLVSYFSNKSIEFSLFFTFWVLFISGFIVEGIVLYISKIYKYISGEDKNSLFVGEAIGYENPFVFKVEIDLQKTKVSIIRGDLVRITLKGESDVFGVVVDQKILLNKKWLTVYLLKEKTNFIRAPRFGFIQYGNIISNSYKVYKADIDQLHDELKDIINQNALYKNRNNFIGYIEQGSDINKIKFYIFPSNSENKIVEGTIVAAEINNKEVLFQIIDGNTKEEGLDHHDKHTFISVTARKLGEYSNKEIISVRWLPEMYTPVFLLSKDHDQITITKKDIGILPGTSYPIEIKDFNSLITHNTAILGILGIGKSCLTFELIKKVVENTETKVICIDITNEYEKELQKYINSNQIEKDEMGNDFLVDLKKESVKTGSDNDSTQWGNKKYYEGKIQDRINLFYDNKDKRILILNPDWHAVTETSQQFKITHCDDLSIAQKTRIISERAFVVVKNIWERLDSDKSKLKPKMLIVFEEAHSLIPEWNSAANNGDQSASNGTAKVILQGRKYGLGSFVITQRTANISKSILNQCNTIFAMRVFDDTGKQFLENYIGSDYSNTLPTLEERHAISIGKALKLKQPVIIKLNEMTDIIGKTKPNM